MSNKIDTFSKGLPVAPPDSVLEDSNHEETRQWVSQQNELTKTVLGGGNFSELVADCRKQVVQERSTDPCPQKAEDGRYYRIKGCVNCDLGVWQRTDKQGLQKDQWADILDLDEYCESRGSRWILQSYQLQRDSDHALLSFSQQGSDAVEIKEYDLANAKFVENGFNLEFGENECSWVDRDTVLFASERRDPDTIQSEGSRHPTSVKRWTRGKSIGESQVIFNMPYTPGGEVKFYHYARPEQQYLLFTVRDKNHLQTFYYPPDFNKPGTTVKLDIPTHTHISGFINGKMICMLGSDWTSRYGQFGINSVVALDLSSVSAFNTCPKGTLIHRPSRFHIKTVAVTLDRVLVIERLGTEQQVLEMRESQSQTWSHSWSQTGSQFGWESTILDYPRQGTLNLICSPLSSEYLVSYCNFLQPHKLVLHRTNGQDPETLVNDEHLFDASQFESKTVNATSFDGTSIPYTLVAPKSLKYDGMSRVLLTGYGGFNVALEPHYLGLVGSQLLEHGYCYAIAYIRGGGEFGSQWHSQAVGPNKPVSYADFATVMTDLVNRRVTSPSRLSIKGASNGGLLVGAMATGAGEQFAAGIGEHGLYDMQRYHLSGKGHLWVSEYGDPNDPSVRQVIDSYSPLHNVDGDEQLPVLFLTSSSNDDRVDPAHSRKMVAEYQRKGYIALLFERHGGGHFGALSADDEALMRALRLRFYELTLAPSDRDGEAELVNAKPANKSTKPKTFSSASTFSNDNTNTGFFNYGMQQSQYQFDQQQWSQYNLGFGHLGQSDHWSGWDGLGNNGWSGGGFNGFG